MKIDLPLTFDSWFYICPSTDLIPNEKKEFNLIDKKILVYRNFQNEVVAIHRFCSHMNADLKLGEVSNSHIKCALHLWCFDKNGIARNGNRNIKSYLVEEKYGHVFVYTGDRKDFSLPFFSELENIKILSSRPSLIRLKNKWFVGPANAFDISHFINVHKRKLSSMPELIELDKHGVMIDLDYEILGSSLSDNLLKLLYGKFGGLNFKVYAGNFILATTRVKNFKNYMMIINHPINEHESMAYLIVFAKKSINPFQFLKLKIQAKLSQKFFQDEANSFYGIQFDDETFDENDWMLNKYLNWLKQYFTHQ